MPLSTEAKIEILEGALELLGPNGEHWAKDEYRNNGYFCLLGAVGEVAIKTGAATAELDYDSEPSYDFGGFHFEEFGEFADNVGTEVSIVKLAEEQGWASVPEFNDDSDTVWGDVKKFVEQRITQLKAEA